MATKIDIDAFKIKKIKNKWGWKSAKIKNIQSQLKIYWF